MKTLPVQIRFNDIDMFGHLNNTVYLQFLDMGKYDYFRRLSDGEINAGATAPVVANINCNFLAPTFIDERLEVRTAVESVSDSSFILAQSIVSADGKEKVSARTIMVNIDLKTGRPVTVDAEWREKFGNEEGRDFSEPAK